MPSNVRGLESKLYRLVYNDFANNSSTLTATWTEDPIEYK